MATVDPRQLLQLDRVEPALARLDLGHEALRAAEGGRDLGLGQPGVAAGRSQIGQHLPVGR